MISITYNITCNNASCPIALISQPWLRIRGVDEQDRIVNKNQIRPSQKAGSDIRKNPEATLKNIFEVFFIVILFSKY